MSTVMIKGRFIGGSLFEMKEGKEKYSACIVLDGDKDKKIIEEIRDAAVEAKFGDKLPKGFVDHTVKMGEDEDFPSYEKYYINPKAKDQPKAGYKDSSNTFTLTTREEGIIYPGCHVAASVSAYAYAGNPKEGVAPGVTLSLYGVCFWKKGDVIGTRFDAGDFDDLSSELDEDQFHDTDATTSSLM